MFAALPFCHFHETAQTSTSEKKKPPPKRKRVRLSTRPVFLVSHGKRGRGFVATSRSGD